MKTCGNSDILPSFTHSGVTKRQGGFQSMKGKHGGNKQPKLLATTPHKEA